MLDVIIKLIVLFFVIFDPPASFMVFFTATKKLNRAEKNRIAFLAISIAALLSAMFLIFGQNLLTVLNTNINDFRVAGGIILGILGIKMALGQPLAKINDIKGDIGMGVASVIGTPLLTGPAAISAIIVSVSDYGIISTGAAVGVVLVFSAILLYSSHYISRYFGKTSIQVMSTILGLITLAWGVGFIKMGLGI